MNEKEIDRNASPVCYADDPMINPAYRIDPEETDMSRIKNIIFDLGNVIVDLDITKADEAFYQLTGARFMNATHEDLKVFNQFETGDVSEALFFNHFIKKSNNSVQAIDIMEAWNAMLVEIPWKRLVMMRNLMDKYRVLILSNTNETHIRWTNHYIQTRYQEVGFSAFVHKAHYSHKLHLRKPDPQIFRKILDEHRMIPGETLFFDDHADNVNTAVKLGIQTVLVNPGEEIVDIIDRVLAGYESKKA